MASDGCAAVPVACYKSAMLLPRTFKILLALLGGYMLLALPAYIGPVALQEISGWFALAPVLVVYLLHHWGVPGLLEHGGACGWGWCSPTALGWTVLAAFWLGVAWLAAWGLGKLVARWTRSRAR